MWLRTEDGQWYVCEIRGSVFVTWVAEIDKAHALVFPVAEIDLWKDCMEKATKIKLEAVTPFA